MSSLITFMAAKRRKREKKAKKLIKDLTPIGEFLKFEGKPDIDYDNYDDTIILDYNNYEVVYDTYLEKGTISDDKGNTIHIRKRDGKFEQILKNR